MASRVTQLMIAAKILEALPTLKRKEFCVRNIAPDCNVENEDWSAFTPPREITHWMTSGKKVAADCERFLDEYIVKRKDKIGSESELSFLLGYYAHLVADAEFQRYIRDEERVAASWQRIKNDSELAPKAVGMEENFDSAKILIGKKERMADISTIEAEYLEAHPDSGFLTEIVPLKDFPDYIDYLPHGAIVRKIGVMGQNPKEEASPHPFILMTREEYETFINNAVLLAVKGIAGIIR